MLYMQLLTALHSRSSATFLHFPMNLPSWKRGVRGTYAVVLYLSLLPPRLFPCIDSPCLELPDVDERSSSSFVLVRLPMPIWYVYICWSRVYRDTKYRVIESVWWSVSSQPRLTDSHLCPLSFHSVPPTQTLSTFSSQPNYSINASLPPSLSLSWLNPTFLDSLSLSNDGRRYCRVTGCTSRILSATLHS